LAAWQSSDVRYAFAQATADVNIDLAAVMREFANWVRGIASSADTARREAVKNAVPEVATLLLRIAQQKAPWCTDRA
jgi:predicted alpha/beta hydrolase